MRVDLHCGKDLMLTTVPQPGDLNQNGNNQLKHSSKVHDSSLPHHLWRRNGNMSFTRHEDGVAGRGSAINYIQDKELTPISIVSGAK